MTRMKILFLTPPFSSSIEYPFPDIPSLVSFMRKNGYDVSQSDINVSFIYELLEKNLFTAVLKNIREMFIRLNKKDALNYHEQKDLLTLEKYTGRGISLNKCAKIKYQKMRKGEKVSDWTEIINSVIKISYTETFGTSIGLYGKLKSTNIAEIADVISKKSDSVFYEYADNYIKNEVTKIVPDIVCISLLSSDQLGASLLTAKLLKKYLPEVRIYFGGRYITLIHATISKDEKLYDFTDGLIVGDGEYALMSVVKQLETNDSSVNIPNFINGRNSKPVKIVYDDINKYPEPDFDDLDLTKYVRPGSLPIYTSKGCNWGKCAFCSVNEGGGYRKKNMATVQNEIKKLYVKYNLKQISFLDDLLTHERMEQIAKYLIENEINIKWNCRARFSESMTEEFFKLMKKSHNTLITLGMESASERMLRLINKGISKQTIDYVISNCEKADQYISLDLMIGLPTETKKEANETLAVSENLRKKYPNLRFQVNTQRTRIERNSDFAREPEKYGINILGRNGLSTTLDWLIPEWTDEYIARHRKHLYPGHDSVVGYPRNYKLNNYLLELKPEKKALAHLITSNYNLADLSKNVAEIENEIKSQAVEKGFLLREPSVSYSKKNVMPGDGEQYCYITINKFNFKNPGRRYKVSSLVRSVFELCNGHNTINEILSNMMIRCQTNKISPERMHKNIMTSLNQLYSIGAINVRLNQRNKNRNRIPV